MSAELTEKYGKAYDIQIPAELAAKFMQATDAEGRAAVEKKIIDFVASKVPSTLTDKWNAWRYFAMLFNPRTHIRNMVGNAGFTPIRMVKNVIGAGLESAYGGLAGKDFTRTKAVYNPLSELDNARWKLGSDMYPEVVDLIQNGGKFTDAQSKIDAARKIFGGNILDTAISANSKLLDIEDTLFSRPAFAESLAGWLKANGITAESYAKLPEATKNAAKAYAVKEAQKATYRDFNQFSDFISKLGKNYDGKNMFAKAGNALVEGVLPFKRTPANIVARAFEYSPGGLIKGIADMRQIGKTKVASEVMDEIASGLTGTGLLALGYMLAKHGWIQGGETGEKPLDDFRSGQGIQPYSITVGNKNITLDWLAPEAIPLFMGVEYFNKDIAKGKSDPFSKALAALMRVTNPLLETSMLNGLQDAIDSVKYAENSSLVDMAANIGFGYLSQGVPTLFGQAERIAEDKRQSTYSLKNSPLSPTMQYMLGKNMNKLPGEFQQMTYVDMWGRKQSTGDTSTRIFNNLFNPSYVADKTTSALDTEVERVFKATSKSGVFPDKTPPTELKYQGKAYALTGTEMEKYQTTRGQTAQKAAQAAISDAVYSKLSDERKAEILSSAMNYANYVAQKEYFATKRVNYESDAYKSQYRIIHDYGIPSGTYFVYKYGILPKYDADGNSSYSSAEVATAISSVKGLTQQQRAILWQETNTKWSPKNNPFT
jgi:hypothetical protein